MMLRKLILIMVLMIPLCAFADLQHDALVANIQYDWIDKTALEKEEIIKEIHDVIFQKPIEVRKDLKKLYKDRLKDKDHYNHYMAASAGHKEYEDVNISAFYYKKMAHLYMYAIQEKKDLTKSYYYDAMGNLAYIDFNEGEILDYPYYSIQYKINGKPISVIYFVSQDCQYLYSPDGEFVGVWYKHKLYNMRNKIILTRTTY